MYGILTTAMMTFRRNLPIWWLLFGIKVVLGLAICVPLLSAIDATLSRSVFANILTSEWSFDVVGELAGAEENVFSMFLVALVAMLALAFLVRQFLNGGIYRSFLSGASFHRKSFFGNSAELFDGNLRISGVMIIIYIGLGIVGIMLGGMIPGVIVGGFGKVSLLATILRAALFYPLMIAGSIFSDLLRYRLAALPSEGLRARIKFAADQMRRRFFKLNLVYYAWFVPFAMIWLVVEWLALQITSGLGSFSGVILELILFQFCSLLRTGQSLLGIASIGIVSRELSGVSQPVAEDVRS